MSETQVDLFGFTTSGLSFKEQQQVNASSRKAPVRLQIDRKALWSQNSYGFGGIRELDDDEDLAEATSTSDTKADNMTIERLEISIGLAPVIKNGKWVQDELGYTYRRVGKSFKGERQLGARGSIVRDLNKQNVLTMARRAMEPLFNDPCCWIILNSIGLLAARLNLMDDDEDPYACLAAFLEVMCQHDFIDNQRSGDTIRSITRRENERDRRRNKKAIREATKGAHRSNRPQDDADDRNLDDDSND